MAVATSHSVYNRLKFNLKAMKVLYSVNRLSCTASRFVFIVFKENDGLLPACSYAAVDNARMRSHHFDVASIDAQIHKGSRFAKAQLYTILAATVTRRKMYDL